MADKKKGYVPVWRSIQDHWIWKYKEPFDHRSAWIDLLLMVNHKEEKIPIGSRVQTIRPGQRWLSYKGLAHRWGWSYRKVLRFVTQLVSDGMAQVDGTPNGTLLTIVNWGNFNGRGTTHGTTDGTTDDTSDGITPVITDGITDGIQTIMINNDNNVKNVNKKDRSVCPGKGWYWDEEGQRWIAPPKEGEEWQ